MNYLVLKKLNQSELGWFAEYRRLGKETSKQRAINFDSVAVDRVFPLVTDQDILPVSFKYRGDVGVVQQEQLLRRQHKNWRLTGNKIEDRRFHFVSPGDLMVMSINSTVSPPQGVFEVIPSSSEAYTKILSTPDSSPLVGKSIAALSATEASKIFQIIRDMDPELFPMDDIDSQLEILSQPTNELERTPNPDRMVNVIANIGHSLKVAVADLIDNSIDVNAKNIDIYFPEPLEPHGRILAIADDGEGMTRSELIDALDFTSPANYENGALGKFGIGLKASSFSQARVLTVCSRKEGHPIEILRWDRDILELSNKWEMIEPTLEEWEEQLFEELLEKKTSGTVVLWSKMSPPPTAKRARSKRSDTAYGQELKELALHLEMVFHRYLAGNVNYRPQLRIYLNGNPLEPWDPFFREHPKSKTLDGFTIPLPAEDGVEHNVLVTPYTLPARSLMNEDEHHRAGHGNKWNQMQGFYVYRGDRLIHAGGWCDLWQRDEKTKLSRVAIQFNSALDSLFDINVAKMDIHLPAILGDELIQKLQTARAEARQAYNKKENRNSKLPTDIRAKTKAPPHQTPAAYTIKPERLVRPKSQVELDLSGEVQESISAPTLELRKLPNDAVWNSRKDMAGNQLVSLNSNSPIAQALYNSIAGDEQAEKALSLLLSSIDTALSDSKDIQTLLSQKLKQGSL